MDISDQENNVDETVKPKEKIQEAAYEPRTDISDQESMHRRLF